MDLDSGAFPLDVADFLGAIQDKANLLRDGHEAGAQGAGPLQAEGLLFAGMGFSGVSADLVKDACTRALDMPFTVVKHYQFPHHVAQEAVRRGVPVTGFTTGGGLAATAGRVIEQPSGYQPRAAFAFTWFSILGYLEAGGLLQDDVPVAAATQAIQEVDAACGPDVPTEDNEAKQLALKLYEKIPQIYATPAFYGVGKHFRGMLNENAKKIADVDLVPECNHNDLTGWGDDPNRRHFTCLALSHAGQNPQIRRRLEFMQERYSSWAVPWHHHVFDAVHSFQEHVVEQARAIQMLDYTSFYTAMLRGVDPSAIREIQGLKAILASQEP